MHCEKLSIFHIIGKDGLLSPVNGVQYSTIKTAYKKLLMRLKII